MHTAQTFLGILNAPEQQKSHPGLLFCVLGHYRKYLYVCYLIQLLTNGYQIRIVLRAPDT